MKQNTLQTAFHWAAVISFGILVIWLLGKYLFAGVLPFLLAYPLSLIIKPLASALAKKARLQKNFCCVLIIFLVIGFTVLLVTWLVSTLISESQGLVSTLVSALEKEDNFIRRTVDQFSALIQRLPFSSGGEASVTDKLYQALMDALGGGLSRLTSSLALSASRLFARLPRFIFSLITTVIALFYFSMDRGGITSELRSVLGYRLTDKLLSFKVKATKAFTGYMKSYLIIMLITFAELFFGFVLLRVEYAVLLAFVIAAIDLLPVLGSGAVIVPWGFLCIATGDVRRGVGLFILGGIMYIVRQITEPHILGSVMGIHPLISLFSVYLGFVLFGFCGILLFPFLTYIIKAVFFSES